MSKFSKMIRVSQTERRFPQRESSLLARISSTREVPVAEVSKWEQEYRFNVELGGCARINPLQNTGEQIEHHRRRIAQMMVEAVFGEFRHDLYELRHEIHMGNHEEAERLIVKITETMFDI